TAALGAVSAAALGAITRAGTIATTIARAVARAVTGPVASPIAGTVATAITCTIPRAIAGVQHLLAVAATEVHAIADTGLIANIDIAAETVGDILVGIFDALAMYRVVLPVVNIGGAVDVEIVVAPTAAAAPVIAPAPDGPACAKGKAGRDHAC